MTTYHAQYDPTYHMITKAMEYWNYGEYKDYVVQHITVFLKQYSKFKVTRKKIQYGMSPQIYLVVLSGAVPIKYQMKDYSIPVNMVLSEKFPMEAPKVFLTYQLDSSHSTQNPLIKHGNQVYNNYLHKWDGTSQQYNLGGLCYNLSKSFSLYPPFGTQGGATTDTDTIYINDGSTKAAPKDVINQKYKQAEPQKFPGTATAQPVGTAATKPLSEEEQVKLLAESARKEAIKEWSEKLKLKVDNLNSSVNNLDIESGRKYLEDNATKIEKQTMILENEITYMTEGIEEMKKLEKMKDISEQNIDDYVYASKDGVSESLLEILAKENAIEDTIDVARSCFRKKKIDIEVYMDTVRELSESQFFNLAMKRKIEAMITGL